MKLEIKDYELYDKNKYSDNFGSKPNPFKMVCFLTATYKNGHKMEIILKFTDTKRDNERSLKKAKQFLKEFNIFEEEEIDQIEKNELLQWLENQRLDAINEDMSYAYYLVMREIRSGKFDIKEEE